MDQPRVAVVVEDDADIRFLISAVLEQSGFQVVSASSGPEGVDAVRTHAPVITTLDVSMPGFDGHEAARRIRAFSDTYIVMITARAEQIDSLQGIQAGADEYITKPFRPRDLRARIAALFEHPRASRSSD
ncbi:response regulator transcription factor [Microbacterium sp. NPDC078428]|uniref:response regulator transcription factor n=1 Tax=Microbacterium sp. NPDC078428 TaxID=3364190 RepID=UPI0037C7B43F